jgi:hypothetical protein
MLLDRTRRDGGALPVREPGVCARGGQSLQSPTDPRDGVPRDGERLRRVYWHRLQLPVAALLHLLPAWAQLHERGLLLQCIFMLRDDRNLEALTKPGWPHRFPNKGFVRTLRF